jgi:hypothetical protein
MSYLICENCSGYYKLKEGENPEDFESCECGGTLRYVQNLNSHIDEELDPINEINICPDCGTESPASEKYCKSCGKLMNDDFKKEENNSSNSKGRNTLNKLKLSNSLLLRAIAIIIGILIVVIPTFLFAHQNYSLALLLIGGVVTSLIVGGKSEDGALNGFVMGLIAALVVLIFRGNFIFTSDVIFNLEIFFFEMSGAVLILSLFGLIGGVIGVLIRDLLVKIKKR